MHRASLGLVLPACLSTVLVTASESQKPESVEGLWLSQGYGLFLEVADGEVAIAEVTAVSCIPREDALVRVAVEPNGTWRLQVGDDLAAAFLGLHADNVARLKRTGTVSDILLRRTSERPAVCERVVEDTPQMAFDVFWTTFREHYPFFEMKSVDWNDVKSSAASRITPATTDEELYDLLVEAMAPLEDAHTGLTAASLGRRSSFMRSDPELGGAMSTSRADVDDILEPRFARALEIVESRYLEGELRSFCGGHLRYGELPGDIAYLWLDQEGDYTDEPGFASQLRVFEEALDTIFTAARDANGLILDVRKNYGGSDVLSLALASRLATSETFAYAKVARLDSDDPTRFTSPQERRVPTSSRPSFAGPVVELTGRYTISAGETLTQALMGREPHITRIGEHTQGVFSDVMGRRLPNGWRFRVPNELFLTEDGTSFDGPGIPPDIEVPVFTNVDLESGRDPALERALAHLGAPRP